MKRVKNALVIVEEKKLYQEIWKKKYNYTTVLSVDEFHAAVERKDKIEAVLFSVEEYEKLIPLISSSKIHYFVYKDKYHAKEIILADRNNVSYLFFKGIDSIEYLEDIVLQYLRSLSKKKFSKVKTRLWSEYTRRLPKEKKRKFYPRVGGKLINLQYEILYNLLTTDLTHAEIAKKLGYTLNKYIGLHLHTIFYMLEVDNAEDAVMKAYTLGMG